MPETEEGAKFLEETFPNWFKEPDLSGIEKLMEEMANAPREELGKRQPGERGMYERTNLERARVRYSELGLEVPKGLREEA